jgi:PilZ domain
MEFRRRVPRQIAGWFGTRHIEGGAADEPRRCRVIDVSELGVGIQLDHPFGSALVGPHIVVETPVMANSGNIRLEGEVRNVVPAEDGSVRLGSSSPGSRSSNRQSSRPSGSSA